MSGSAVDEIILVYIRLDLAADARDLLIDRLTMCVAFCMCSMCLLLFAYVVVGANVDIQFSMVDVTEEEEDEAVNTVSCGTAELS